MNLSVPEEKCRECNAEKNAGVQGAETHISHAMIDWFIGRKKNSVFHPLDKRALYVLLLQSSQKRRTKAKTHLVPTMNWTVPTWSARDCSGVTNTHLHSGICWRSRSTANSAQMVFPLPVGAPIRTFSSELYMVLKTSGGKKKMEWMPFTGHNVS